MLKICTHQLQKKYYAWKISASKVKNIWFPLLRAPVQLSNLNRARYYPTVLSLVNCTCWLRTWNQMLDVFHVFTSYPRKLAVWDLSSNQQSQSGLCYLLLVGRLQTATTILIFSIMIWFLQHNVLSTAGVCTFFFEKKIFSYPFLGYGA